MEWAFEHMERKVRYDRTAFHLSAAYGRLECIEFLREEATNLWNKLAVSSKVKDFNYFDPFATDNTGKTPLHWAIYNKNSKVIKPLLKLDDKKMLNAQDTNGITPLHIAASSKELNECLRVLIEEGADLDLKDKVSGYTALHIACAYRDNDENVKFLLEKSTKKQVNALSTHLQQTPLMIAACYGMDSNIKLLLQSGKCDITMRDICGDYALHHAIKNSNKKCVTILVEEIKKQGGEVLSTLYTEDGMGLSCLDFSMNKMANTVVDNRSYKEDVNVPIQLSEIYHYISSNTNSKRLLTTNDYTRETTNVILNGVESQNFQDFFGVPHLGCPTFEKFADEQKPSKETEKMEDSEDEKNEKDDESSSSSSEEDDESPSSFKGMTICISGTFSVKRTKIETIIKKNGGKISASVTKSTTHLLTDDTDSDTSKAKRARELGIKLVTEKFISKFL